MTIGKLLERIMYWHRDREAISMLAARSDRELNDIGLYRGDIVKAVKGKLHTLAA